MLNKDKILEGAQKSNTQKITELSASLRTKKLEAAEHTATFRHEVTLKFRIGMNRGLVR